MTALFILFCVVVIGWAAWIVLCKHKPFTNWLEKTYEKTTKRYNKAKERHETVMKTMKKKR